MFYKKANNGIVFEKGTSDKRNCEMVRSEIERKRETDRKKGGEMGSIGP